MSGFLSPGMTAGLAAGAEGGDLATQMLIRQLQAKAAQAKLQDEDKQRQAQAIQSQAFMKLMSQQGVSPPGGQPSPGGAPQGGGTAAPPPGGAMPPGQPGAALSAPQPPQGGSDMPATSGPQLTWPAVMQMVSKIAPNADPQTLNDVIAGFAPLVESSAKEQYNLWKAKQDLDLKQEQRLDKLFMNQQNLDFKYATTTSAEEKASLQQQRMENQKEIQRILTGGRRDVAEIQAEAKTTAAETGAEAKKTVAETQAKSRMDVTKLQNAEKEKLEALKTINANAARQVADLQKQRAAQDRLYQSIGSGLTGNPKDPRLPAIQSGIDKLTKQINELLTKSLPSATVDSPAVTKAEPAPEDPAKRVVGKSYSSPDGKIAIWTDKGWQPVEVGK